MIPEHRAKRGLWLKPIRWNLDQVRWQPYSRPSQPSIPIHPGARRQGGSTGCGGKEGPGKTAVSWGRGERIHMAPESQARRLPAWGQEAS